MKVLCIALLLANVGYFAWQLDRHLDAPRAGPSGTPYGHGAVTLVLLEEMTELPQRRGEAAADSVTEIAGASATDGHPAAEAEAGLPADGPAVPATIAEGAAAGFCFRVGPLSSLQQAVDLGQELEGFAAHVRQRRELRQERQYFWVYLEPTESRPQAEQLLAELRRKGIEDILLVRKGEMENAVSLGLFRNQDSVNRRLNELARQGYQPVVVPRYRDLEAYWLDLRFRDPPDAGAIELLRRSSQWRELACSEIASAPGAP